ncbi:hypothetical protein BT69DRAFT_1317559 [Atractiella rhizophila]|nr:hypothetical protein BT69DRAFT_1348047 [Atractiella rhizophila]KAH8926548.1 hypothetical protein BT69DRAFT_1317559 [Atractiella rhizophila]
MSFKTLAIAALAASAFAIEADLGVAHVGAGVIGTNGGFVSVGALDTDVSAAVVAPQLHNRRSHKGMKRISSEKRHGLALGVDVSAIGAQVAPAILFSLDSVIVSVQGDVAPIVQNVKGLVGDIQDIATGAATGDVATVVSKLQGELQKVSGVVSGAVTTVKGLASGAVDTVEGVAPTPEKVAVALSTVTTQLSGVMSLISGLDVDTVQAPLDNVVSQVKTDLADIYSAVGAVAAPVLAIVDALLSPVEGLLNGLGLGFLSDIINTVV